MDEPSHYEIRVEEHIDEHWTHWFDGLKIVHSSESGGTILHGEIRDQPALFGALAKIRDLGLTLISVQRLPSVGSQPSVGRE